MFKILITGGSGDLGCELVNVLGQRNVIYCPTHDEMDVTSIDRVFDTVESTNPDYIVHTAAMIDARKCEEDWKRAREINVTGTYNMAIAADMCGAKLIHVSSTCVFDGENAPFTEFSKPSPKNWYALTKFAAETAVQAVSNKFLIVRTNFVARKPWKYPSAFTDRFGTYLFADDVAYGISTVMQMKGIVHVCGEDRISMYDLAKMVSPDVKPMTLQDYQGPPLSRDMSLESVRIDPFKLGSANDILKS